MSDNGRHDARGDARTARGDGRALDELRPVSFERDYTVMAPGSVLVAFAAVHMQPPRSLAARRHRPAQRPRAEREQHQRDAQLERVREARRQPSLEHGQRYRHREQRRGVAKSPEDAEQEPGTGPLSVLARDQRRNSREVIGLTSMAHAQENAEQWTGHRFHRLPPRPSVAYHARLCDSKARGVCRSIFRQTRFRQTRSPGGCARSSGELQPKLAAAYHDESRPVVVQGASEWRHDERRAHRSGGGGDPRRAQTA